MDFINLPVTPQFPSYLLSDLFGSNFAGDYSAELNNIAKFYSVYIKGASFPAEGSNGDYRPADLHYKMSASLIDREARFLFAQCPDITAVFDGEEKTEELAENIDKLNKLLRKVFEQAHFEANLLKAARDCFIGKRIAILTNFADDGEIALSFLPSLNFAYLQREGELVKFLGFYPVMQSEGTAEKYCFYCKYYEAENGVIYVSEYKTNLSGMVLEETLPKQKTLLNAIPAVIVTNSGLCLDEKGKSEISDLLNYEFWYSLLANGDIDAERKSMNPVKFVVDMAANSTKNLSSAAGAFWDLGSDQNLETPKTQVGLLEPGMHYSATLNRTLERVQTAAYSAIDMPNTNLESLQGVITSGKALKAIYWPLIVRCREKMQTWRPALRLLADTIILGAVAYPACISYYLGPNEFAYAVDYKIDVVENLPLPEDEAEEKQLDLAEVQAEVMSRKSYMQKWRLLSESEAERELVQIARERQLLENATFEET